MRTQRPGAGFTLTEVLTSLAVLSLVITAASVAYTMSIRVWRNASARISASSAASLVLTRCTMGVDNGFGLRAGFLSSVDIASETNGWQIGFTAPTGVSGEGRATNTLAYSVNSQTITYRSGTNSPTIIGRNIVASSVGLDSDTVTITVQAQATTGNTNVISEMSTAITPRNRS
jgi:prepilin-type N-terminal cleavage/methylation domain-containing protein